MRRRHFYAREGGSSSRRVTLEEAASSCRERRDDIRRLFVSRVARVVGYREIDEGHDRVAAFPREDRPSPLSVAKLKSDQRARANETQSTPRRQRGATVGEDTTTAGTVRCDG